MMPAMYCGRFAVHGSRFHRAESRKTVIGDRRAAQRLLVTGVTASTVRLVRGLRDGCCRWEMLRLLGERRRMYGELAASLREARYAGRLQALSAAVAESDRAMEELLK
jgi:hypothetical protein